MAHPTLDGQQLKWSCTIESEQTGLQIPGIETEQSVTVINKESDASGLNSNDANRHPVIAEIIETEDFGKLRSANNDSECEADSPPIYENMSKSYLETVTRPRNSSESSYSSTSTSSRSLSRSETQGIDQKTYILEKPTVPPKRERREVVDDYDPAYDVAHAFPQKNSRPIQSVEFDDSERDIDFEMNHRRARASSPYSTILNLEVDEDDIRAREIHSSVTPVPVGMTPIAAGVKTSRLSITPAPDKPEYKPESPVYSVVNKKKVVHSDESILRPYNDNKIELEEQNVTTKTKRESKKSNKKNPLKLSIFGKSKDKKVSIRRQISGPVGQVVHYSGQSDSTQMKTLGVGIYEEGARTGSHPGEETRPTGQVEIVNFAPESDEGDDLSDPTLHQTMFVDIRKENSEVEYQVVKKKKKPQKRVTIITDTQNEENKHSDSEPTFRQSMFSDVQVKQKPIPPPLLEPSHEIDPPDKFRDSKPAKQQKPPRRAVRQVSKDDIGLPLGTVIHEVCDIYITYTYQRIKLGASKN